MPDLSEVPTPSPAMAAEPSPIPSPVPTPVAHQPTGSGGGGVKETIESILVAFILAFVFRAFVVEAFVIPTGSMATTLLGAHTRYHCPDCGYAFDLNYSSNNPNDEDDDVSVPATADAINTPIYCPNCGFRMPDEQVKDPPPPVAYGDRILVLKYLYLLSHPSRWDVVVFKSPTNPNQNYIKRLTGLPGEAVKILDGAVYVRPPGDTDPAHFVVQTKPPDVQNAMWRLVYDNDFHPQAQLDRAGYPWQQPWRVEFGSGCDLDGPGTHGRTFGFDVPRGSAKLRYDPTADPSTQGFSDYLVYNQNTRYPSQRTRFGEVVEGSLVLPARSPERGWSNPTDVPVSDLDLRLTYQRTAGAGPFVAALSKRAHTFSVELTPATATLYDDVGTRHTAIGVPYPLPAGGRPVRVELSNADYRVTLRVDGAVAAQTTPAQYAPDVAALTREYDQDVTAPPPTATIRADDQQSRVSHLSLWRDVYYYNRSSTSKINWATPDNPQQLGPDEYFTQGDNSQLSYDARCWDKGIHLPGEHLEVDPGRVPGRFLLGKAFYVYWPAGYKAASWLPGFVPNFGGMRMIH